jgi:hypothetical protein
MFVVSINISPAMGSGQPLGKPWPNRERAGRRGSRRPRHRPLCTPGDRTRHPRRPAAAIPPARLSQPTPPSRHTAQPHGIQGRHCQPQRGRRPGPDLGGGPGRAGLGNRRHVPGGAPHPHAHRVLGPHHPRRTGGDHRPAPATAVPRWTGPPRPTSPTTTGIRPACSSRWTRTSGWRTPAPRRARPTGSCAAVTTTTVACCPTGTSTPVSSSAAFSRTSVASSRPSKPDWPRTRSTTTSARSAAVTFFALPGVTSIQDWYARALLS